MKLVNAIITDSNIISKRVQNLILLSAAPIKLCVFYCKKWFSFSHEYGESKVAFCVGNAGRTRKFISNNNVYSSLLSAVYLLKICSRYSNSGKGYEIFFSETSRTGLRSIQPSIQRLPGVKRPGIKTEHLSSSRVELKMGGTILPLRPTCWDSMNGDILTLSLQLNCYSIVLLLIVYLYLCQNGVPRAMVIRMREQQAWRSADLGTLGKMAEWSRAVTQSSAVTDFYNFQWIYHRFKWTEPHIQIKA